MSTLSTLITTTAPLVGVFGGALLTSTLKTRSDQAGRVHDWQVTVVEVYGDLMRVLGDHYMTMWDLEAARLRGDAQEIATTLAATLVTRSAVTKPHAQMLALCPQLAEQIEGAVQGTYRMDTAMYPGRSAEELTRRRLAAKAARETLSEAMVDLMRRIGAGLPDPKPRKRIGRRQVGAVES
ncbi:MULTISPECIES: hypothetical protein [Actinosynnema]|uniref:hypothetical protein n=1 Tax=Actinosynnema TaxID=40566 RepID=UPI0020A26235|nr:hypothetical protein [Actinosynnema pretiosum]MCP2093348.1 hypothetical protein [Actinosynnema pretiosum]